MGSERVEINSQYQKQIDRSFTIIYHNLKRIQENKMLKAQESECSNCCQHCEIPKSESSQQLRREAADLTGGSHFPTRDQSHSVARGRFHSAKQVSKETKGRRVSFSVDTVP